MSSALQEAVRISRDLAAPPALTRGGLCVILLTSRYFGARIRKCAADVSRRGPL